MLKELIMNDSPLPGDLQDIVDQIGYVIENQEDLDKYVKSSKTKPVDVEKLRAKFQKLDCTEDEIELIISRKVDESQRDDSKEYVLVHKICFNPKPIRQPRVKKDTTPLKG